MGYSVPLGHLSAFIIFQKAVFRLNASPLPPPRFHLYPLTPPTLPRLPLPPAFSPSLFSLLCDLERVQSPELGVNFQLQRVRGKSRGGENDGEDKRKTATDKQGGLEERREATGAHRKCPNALNACCALYMTTSPGLMFWFHSLPPHRHHNLRAHSHLKGVFHSTCASLSLLRRSHQIQH